MAVKIRLARRGRKKLAMFDVVVAKASSPRDGRFIEKIGTYNPNTNPATIVLDETKAFNWVMNGAQPTDTVRAMLSYRGILLKKHLQVGVNKGAITQEAADTKFEEWKQQQESKISGKVESLAQKKEAARKARFEAEAKVKEARAEALRKKNEVVAAAEAPEEEPLSEHAEQTPVAEAALAEAKAEEETPKAEETSKTEEPVSENAEQAPVAEAAAPAEEAPEAKAAEEAPKKEESAEEAAEEKKEE